MGRNTSNLTILTQYEAFTVIRKIILLESYLGTALAALLSILLTSASYI